MQESTLYQVFIVYIPNQIEYFFNYYCIVKSNYNIQIQKLLAPKVGIHFAYFSKDFCTWISHLPLSILFFF